MNALRITAGVVAVLLAACGREDPRVVAKAGDRPVTRDDAAKELRSILWRRGETWDALEPAAKTARRSEAVQNVIDDQLTGQFAEMTTKDTDSLRHAKEEDFEQLLKQFPGDEWKQRMQLQGLNERTLRERLGAETANLAAIEVWLAQQPGRVAEADARAWFEAHQPELVIPERVRASHIFLTRHDKDKPDKSAEIKEIYRKLVAQEATFEELAKLSDDENNKLRGGDLGWFSRKRVPEEFAKVVFSLPVGKLSEPFESHLGWHIVIVKEKLPQRPATFEESKDEITAMLESRWRDDVVKRLLEELRAKAKIELYPANLEKVVP